MELCWLSISEYAQYLNISHSTVRRYIKANKVIYKLSDGKYQLAVDKRHYVPNETKERELYLENLELKQEIAELKMLVQLYESKIYTHSSEREVTL